MIEAVENHNPEVIVIDEIGRELEAMAARTIAERGVQLVATAHGRSLENLLLNPTLSDLIGGIESVTLSDEEARRRGTQKTVLERRSPPTFDVLIELQERDRLVVHPDVAAAVDTLVRGFPIQPEVRYRDENDEIHIEKAPRPAANRSMSQGTRRTFGNGMEETIPQEIDEATPRRRSTAARTFIENPGTDAETSATLPSRRILHIYPYGVARNRLEQAARHLGLNVQIARIAADADVVMTLRTYYRSRQEPVMDAEARGIPIYVLRANTINQMEQSLAEIFNLPQDSVAANLEEVTNQIQSAIKAVLSGQHWVDLPPASASVRRVQHEMARQANLVSQSFGKEPNRRVRIFRE
jgi:hypothetical protein